VLEYGLGEGKETIATWPKVRGYPDRTRLSPKVIGIPAYNQQCSGAALPDGNLKVI